MFDLNEPADEPAAELAPEQKRQEQEEAACSALSLLAESAGCWKKLDVQEDKLDKPATECRDLSPVSSEDNDEISSAAKEWSLRMQPPSRAEAISKQAVATERSSSWPRSERPSLKRSGSLHMLFGDGPKSPINTNVDSSSLALRDSHTEDGKMCLGPEDSKRDETTPGRAETSSRPGKNLMFECEFLQLKTNESNMEVLHDEDLASTAPRPPFSLLSKEPNGDGAEADLMCIDAFGQHDKNDTREVSDRIKQVCSGDPLVEDSRFGTLFWRGQINFEGLTVPNLVAGCTRAWQEVFKNRKLPIDLTVQRFAGTEKFLNAVKEYMAEPAVRVIQSSNTSSQNYNKLVQVLIGGSTEVECRSDLSPSKGPSIAIIPLYDEGNAWIAELYLVSASILSDAEPGELNVSDEDLLYAFLSLSADLNESFTGLKDGGGVTYIDSGKLVSAGANETSQRKSLKKQPSTSGDTPVDKRVLPQGGRGSRASSELSSDPRQDLEEGQLVGEEQGAKEVICTTTYERRKRYAEDDKKVKVNGDADVKTRDRHRHRDHERERDQDRERARRDRDRDVDYRERDREAVYTRSRSGNYDYLSRLDSKVVRHRDTDKDRNFRDGHRDTHWENGDRGGSIRERFRDSERSRSREREKERDRAAEKISKELTRSRSAMKSLESSKGKPVSEVIEKSFKKRERSPVEPNKVNGKRLKDGNKDAFVIIDGSRPFIAEKKGEDVGPTELVSKPSPYAEVDPDFHMKIQNKDKGDASKQSNQDSDELNISSLELKTKKLGGLVSSNNTCSTVTEVDGDEVYCELLLDGMDQDTRSWLASKQNAIYLREEYGVTLMKKEIATKNNQSQDALHLKLYLNVSEMCDVAEAKYFVHHAADFLKGVAQHGVYCKFLWYPGPVQPFAGEVAPPIHKVVMKIKGDDGKNLDRIQDATGVMAGVVLDADSKKGVKTGLKASVVGLRLSCARKKGLEEATQQAQALLSQVSGFFAKDMDVPSQDFVIADAGASRDECIEVKPKRGTSRPLYVTRLPEYASPRMLWAIFERVLREKLKKDIELPPGFENSTEMVVDVKYVAEDSCAFVEFANDDLVEGALHLYAGDDNVFCGLKVELPSPAALKTYELLQAEEPVQHSRVVSGRKSRAGKEAHGTGDSEGDYLLDGDQIRSANGELGQPSRKPVKPLFLTELIRNASAESVQQLFEDVITDHINPSLVNNNGKSLVLAVRHIPSRGCMFVDLATPELVEFMLDLHNRKPDVFGHMKMELGRSHMPFGEGLEKKRSFHALEKSRSGRTLSPPRSRRRGDDGDDYDDAPDYGRQPSMRKQRSDPEKTVYADHLPENSSEVVIRRVFERVLFKHMTSEQRALWDDVVTEVRHVKTKYCAFVVFVSEDLARLALELYNKDEEIFDRMRLKPHFNSRLEDMYKDEPHERDEEAQSSLDHRGSHTGSEDQYYEYPDLRGRGPKSAGFKEVDRRRSVYIDKIPEKYPESAIKDILDKFLKRKGRGSPSYIVSNVSFFRDKYDQSKLCAFVEVKNENAVQDLLECYAADEEAFEGMRIRPAVKYS